MVFSSIPFLFFFLPIFLIFYFIFPFKNIILLIFSLLFYAWGEPIYIILMIFSSVVDFTLGKLIEKRKNKKFYLILSIVINLLLLGFFKYSDFLILNINNIFNLNINYLNLSLPIGISFFTFQTMSYSIDVYKKNIKAEKNFLTFLTYISMFPQLIAGPIVRYKDVSKELHNRKIKLDNFCQGVKRFLEGLFKKVLIANTMGLLFFEITSLEYNYISVLTAFLAIIAFSLQIYFDFSGYSDMAIGIGKMLGFNYPENFNYPFNSKSITEFWRKWHITLSSWFKDYIYIPLGGNKKNQIRNILIVWGLTGLWHGASYNFLLWGLFFGIILILEKTILKRYIDIWPNFMKRIYTLTIILFSFYIFAFEDMEKLLSFGKILLGISGNAFIDYTFIYYLSNYLIIILIGIILAFPIFKERKKMGIMSIMIYCVLFIITISYLVSDTYNPFLYFRF